MTAETRLLPTTVVGSYPQPDWLVDRAVLAKNLVPRVRMKQIWRVAEDALEQAQDDATLVAIRDMERAGIDIITDGEIRRESYSNRFALALDGVDVDTPAEVIGRTGKVTLVPRVVGNLRRRNPVELRDMQFLRANTERGAKITLPGPFTLSMQAHDEHYGDEEALAMAYAEVVAAEARDLKAAGADVIQLDEPWLQARPEVLHVLHPALPQDPGHAIWKRDFTGACSLFGVVFQPRYTEAEIFRFVDGLKLFGIGASWGGYESLALPTNVGVVRRVTPQLPGQAVRLHIGLEEVEDLRQDLEQGLALLPR
jgi:hypothetical protein